MTEWLPGAESARLSEAWHLGLALPRVGSDGGPVMGRAAGASAEFQDHRVYTPGDDVRKLDWRAYARTDQLMLKRYRQEVRPTLELILDSSRSMDSEPGKAQRAVDLGALLARSGARMGWRVRVWDLGDQPAPLPIAALLERGLGCGSQRPLMDALQVLLPQLSTGAMVVLLSDFLSPHDAASLCSGLGRRAGGLGLLQVLGQWESDPPLGGSLELVDVEGGGRRVLPMDAQVVGRYRARMERLSAALEQESRRVGGRFSRVVSAGSLELSCRELGASGWLVTSH